MFFVVHEGKKGPLVEGAIATSSQQEAIGFFKEASVSVPGF